MKDEGGRMDLRRLRHSLFHPSSFLLPPCFPGAGDETRTRDPQLGRLMLYQLSYTRPNSLPIAHLRLPIVRSIPQFLIGNWQSKIGNAPMVQGVGFEPT
jgi:hypothetical protein